jgi:hypothetical protein
MYETYTREELVALDTRMLEDWRVERRVSDGDGLRAEVARANVREFDRQRKLIQAEIARRDQTK